MQATGYESASYFDDALRQLATDASFMASYYNESTYNYDQDDDSSLATARVINDDQETNFYTTTLPPLANNALPIKLNITRIICQSREIPSVENYFTAINVSGVLIFSLGALAVLAILYMFVDTLKYVMKYAPPLAKSHSAIVISVYPAVAVATYCAIVVPRAHLLAEAITQGAFMVSMYQLFCLLVAYCGGEAELVKRVKPNSVHLNVPPCCCWPCCVLLPTLPINKKNVKLLRAFVLQLPAVQGLIYLILLVMWAEEESLYQVNYMYFQPVIIMSILCGIWAIIMTITMLDDTLKEHRIRSKFLVLQMVLLLAKFQGLFARLAIWAELLPCRPPITPTIYANLIYNTSMLWEMTVLSSMARKLYKEPVTDPSIKKQKLSTVCSTIPYRCPCGRGPNAEYDNPIIVT